MPGDLTVDTWNEISVIAALFTALMGAASIVAGITYNRLKSRIDAQSADDAASDRIIKLVEQEAEKRVQIVRIEFELKIAQMQAEHAQQIADLRKDYEHRLGVLQAEIEQLYKERSEQID